MFSCHRKEKKYYTQARRIIRLIYTISFTWVVFLQRFLWRLSPEKRINVCYILSSGDIHPLRPWEVFCYRERMSLKLDWFSSGGGRRVLTLFEKIQSSSWNRCRLCRLHLGLLFWHIKMFLNWLKRIKSQVRKQRSETCRSNSILDFE